MAAGRMSGHRYLRGRLSSRRVYNEAIRGRLFEPIHLNLFSLGVWAFGSYRTKIDFDLVPRLQYAAGLLEAVDIAKICGHERIVALEFGVAGGAGLLSMAEIARRLTEESGVDIHVYGFDTGTGMPAPVDHRDHPELWQHGDFPMRFEELRSELPPNTSLILGDVRETATDFLAGLSHEPIGFVAVDVDYYSSTVGVLGVLEGAAGQYLPVLPVYLDDIANRTSNPWCGELLAVEEFNERNEVRKICRDPFYDTKRYFRRASWIRKMHHLHVLDHHMRSHGFARSVTRPSTRIDG